MGFSRQEYWSELPCPPLGDLPDPGIEPTFLMSPALAGGFFTTNTIWEAQLIDYSLPNNDETSLFEAKVILFQNKSLLPD